MEDLVLTPEQLDAIKEIGNIGCCNAATALSQLLDKRISVRVPEVKFLAFNELKDSDFMFKPGEINISVSLKILGSLEGGILVLYPQRSALLMVNILTQKKIDSIESFTVMDNSAIMESSHILCCAYLNAIGELLGLYRLVPYLTQTMVDKIDKISEVLIQRFMGQDVRYILPIQNHILIEDIGLDIFVIFLLNWESLKKILKIAGYG
jgi:chemotaxis protein CheC